MVLYNIYDDHHILYTLYYTWLSILLLYFLFSYIQQSISPFIIYTYLYTFFWTPFHLLAFICFFSSPSNYVKASPSWKKKQTYYISFDTFFFQFSLNCFLFSRCIIFKRKVLLHTMNLCYTNKIMFNGFFFSFWAGYFFLNFKVDIFIYKNVYILLFFSHRTSCLKQGLSTRRHIICCIYIYIYIYLTLKERGKKQKNVDFPLL